MSTPDSTTDPWTPDTTAGGNPFGDLHASECKQQFSLAWIHALVTAGRCVMTVDAVDVDGIDLTIKQRKDGRRFSRAVLEVQLKCTSRSDVVKADGLHWKLDKGHYENLIEDETIVHRILVVVKVPAALPDALTHMPDHVIMRERSYWVCLEGRAALPAGAHSKTVVLPASQEFNIEQLLELLDRVRGGGTP